MPIATIAMLVGVTGLLSLRSIAQSARITPTNAIQSVELAKVARF
jgi:hypothetical protein